MTALPLDVLGPDAPAPLCQKHPNAVAGWRCQSCEAALCPDCAVGRRAQSVELVACGRCGGAAQPLLIHRGHVPLATRLKGAWRYVFSPSGLQVVLATSLVLSLLGGLRDMMMLPFLRVLPMALYQGIFWATFYALVRSSARGDKDLDTPEFNDIFRDAIAPSIRGVVTFTLVWTPAMLYAAAKDKGGLLTGLATLLMVGPSPRLLLDPVLWVLVGVGVVWLPTTLMLTAAGQPLSALFNPRMALGMTRKLGRDYLLTAGALAALGGVHLAAHGVGFLLKLLNLFIISRVLTEALTLVAPFTAAHVVGLLLYVRGDSLGYGATRDYLEPVLGDTGPRLAAPPIREAGTLPGSVSQATAALVGTGPREAGEQLSALGAAVEARDVPQAMALYAVLGQLPEVRVPPAHHLFVGQAAAMEGNFPLAVQALERAADVAPDEPTAPRALVLLARVLGERMHEVARAEEVYRYVLHRYPDTSAAAFARERVPHVSSD